MKKTSTLLLATLTAAHAAPLPDAITRALPAGYVVLAQTQGRLTGGPADDYVIALARPDDDPDAPPHGDTAPARPLLVFRAEAKGGYTLAGRNDQVVFRHDQGGQCDPFDPEQGLVMKGAYITVQNEVACGSHWSDYVTFRFDAHRGALLFDSDIYHSWHLNPNDASDADALLPDPSHITRANPHHPIGFSAWTPPP